MLKRYYKGKKIAFIISFLLKSIEKLFKYDKINLTIKLLPKI